MSKYIDAEKLKAEIEKMRKINRKAFEDEHIESGIFHGRAQALNHLYEFIDSLQQKQPEVDLEKEFSREYATYHLPDFILGTLCDGMGVIDFIYKTARHFYELGLKARKEE